MWAFYGCTSLKSINIPDSATEISRQAFYGCTSLKSIDIPDSVTEIGMWAFYGCTSLKSINIPDSATEIGWHAFKGCASLKEIHIKNINPQDLKVDSEAFDGLYEECTLFVPSGTRWRYRHHDVFKRFKNIEIERR